MATSQNSRLYVELSEHALVLARVSEEGASRKIAFWGEAPRYGKDAVDELLKGAGLADAEKPERATVLLRPGRRNFHLSTPEEAARIKTAEEVAAFFSESPISGYEPCEVASVYARSGAQVDGRDNGPWLAAGVSQEEAALSLEVANDWNIKPGRIECATFAWLGACSRILAEQKDGGPVAVCDLGPRSSSIFLVDEKGVSAHATAPVGFDQVMEVIHAELKLKFLGAANRLFFNDRYDFSKIEKTVAGKFAEILQPDLKDLVGAGKRKAASFALIGLPRGQAWLGEAIAAALEMKAWKPDIAAWMQPKAVKWNARGAISDLGINAVGMLQVVSDDPCEKDENRIWRVRWFGQDVTEKVDKTDTEQVIKEATEAAARLKAPVIEHRKRMQEEKEKAAARKAEKAKGKKAGAKLKTRPAASTAGSKAAATAKPVAAKPAQSTPSSGAAQKTPEPVASAQPPARSKKGKLVGIISMAAAIAVMAGGGYMYFQKVEEQKRIAEQKAAAEARARREAEEAARRVAEEKRLAEERARQEALEAEEAKRLAEEKERKHREEMERLLNARGAVVIVTQPEGATVKLGNLAPMQTPARFRDVHLGEYKARIELAGYEPVEIDVTVTENGIFDPGTIYLKRQVGTLAIETEPFSVAYEVRPASAGLFVSSDQIRMGETPAEIDDLSPGEYVVTLLKQGWPTYTETVKVTKDKVFKLSHRFVGGGLKVTSEPAGVSVLVNGQPVGETPLTLEDQAPGEVILSFQLDGYVSKTMPQTLKAGETTEVAVVMEAEDRVRKPSELDELPEPIEMVEPAMPHEAKDVGKSVVISVTIDENGYPSDPYVRETYSAEASRACMDAVMEWRFKPGLIEGRPVKTRVAIPFIVR